MCRDGAGRGKRAQLGPVAEGPECPRTTAELDVQVLWLRVPAETQTRHHMIHIVSVVR